MYFLYLFIYSLTLSLLIPKKQGPVMGAMYCMIILQISCLYVARKKGTETTLHAVTVFKWSVQCMTVAPLRVVI